MSARSNRTDPLTIPPNPSSSALHRGHPRNERLQIRTHQTATVIAVSADGRTVDVLVGSLAVVMDHFAPASTLKPNPTKTQAPVSLTGIPVALWETAAGYFTVPIAPGDTGELHVQDRGVGEWMRAGIPVDPRSRFTHMLGDSIFHPTVRKTGGGTAVDPLATVVDHVSTVKIGAGAVSAVTLDDLLQPFLDTVKTWLDTHIHTAPTGGGPTTPPTVPSPTVTPTGATKALAE